MYDSSDYDEQTIKEIKNSLNTEFKLPTSITGIELLVKGVNYTFKIKCKSTEYFLKVFSASRDASDILFETAVINEFLGNNIGVATTVRSINDNDFIKIRLKSEERFAMLYNSVGGRNLNRSANDIFLFSQALSKIHDILIAPHLKFTTRIFSIENECNRIRKLINCNSDIPKYLASTLIESCQSIQEQVLSETMVLSHGDAWLGNAKYANGTIYFFDLEDSLLANRNFDLGVMAYNLITMKYELGENVDALLKGYNHHSKEVTLKTIKPYIQLRSLFAFCFLLEKQLINNSISQKVFERAEYFASKKFDIAIEQFHA